jgi:two-component system response regulator LytT
MESSASHSAVGAANAGGPLVNSDSRVPSGSNAESIHLSHSSSNAMDERLDALVRLLEHQQVSAQSPAKAASKVVLRVGGRLLLVEQRDICFASIEEGTISVVTHSIEGHSNCRTLEDLLDLLDPELFWRAHRSFVVNIRRIQEVVPWFKSSYQLRMDDRRHTEIPVSRAQTKRLRELFNL